MPVGLDVCVSGDLHATYKMTVNGQDYFGLWWHA